MKRVSEIPVLVITYQRAENLIEIINRCRSSGIRDFFISVDGPQPDKPQSLRAHSEIVTLLDKCKKELDLNLRTRVLSENIGCSASVLNSIDWFFEHTEFGVILEDDCIPGNDFFHFIAKSYDYFDSIEDCMLISGSQFWNSRELDSGMILSKYPNVWGWACTQKKWRLLSGMMESEMKKKKFKYPWFKSVDEIFWYSGMRRAAQGYLDAWDAMLGYVFHKNEFLTLLPNQALIQNIGDDEFASHEMSKNPGIRTSLGRLNENFSFPIPCYEMDSWLRREVYRINFSKLVTTKLSFFFDKIGLNATLKKSIKNQWRND